MLLFPLIPPVVLLLGALLVLLLVLKLLIIRKQHQVYDESDEKGRFTSDCRLEAPNEFAEILGELFPNFLTHGFISQQPLTCALSPIVKDSNGNSASPKNYRAITISSLILKTFDHGVLILIGHVLSNDVLR